MKLLIAIMDVEDAPAVSSELSHRGYSNTALSGRGGFLQGERQVLLTGVEDMRVQDALAIIGENSHTRHVNTPDSAPTGAYRLPNKITVGGAAVFVVDVDQFYKL